ncbi:MAG: PEP-CTERM sorting domain-containing protein [Kiritimatiellae bacterium]|nr:PEP-CTERM sorting domain-containing protein [Kiritimatiellia bacterium]
MKKKMVIFFVFVSMVFCVNAAEVLWGLFSTRTFNYDWSGNGIMVYYYGHGAGVDNIQPETGFVYNCSDGILTSITAGGAVNLGINATVWIDALCGDILTDEYFAALYAANNRVYMDTGFFVEFPDPTGYVREVATGGTLYVAYAGLAIDNTHYYGWLELLVKEEELSLVSSALTYSPGLIVGTGDFAAIPEPSAGVLLLIGLAALALRRQRESYAEQFSAEPRLSFANMVANDVILLEC